MRPPAFTALQPPSRTASTLGHLAGRLRASPLGQCLYVAVDLCRKAANKAALRTIVPSAYCSVYGRIPPLLTSGLACTLPTGICPTITTTTITSTHPRNPPHPPSAPPHHPPPPTATHPMPMPRFQAVRWPHRDPWPHRPRLPAGNRAAGSEELQFVPDGGIQLRPRLPGRALLLPLRDSGEGGGAGWGGWVGPGFRSGKQRGRQTDKQTKTSRAGAPRKQRPQQHAVHARLAVPRPMRCVHALLR